MTKYYEVVGEVVVKANGVACGRGSQVPDDEMDPAALAELIKDGTLVELSTDTGKTPPKEPHPERVEQDITHKVIEPTVKKGKGK